MSLIHWWPLNGDTKDYGTANSNLNVLYGTPSFANGKIGQCANLSNGQAYYIEDSMSCNSVTGYSVASWVYFNSLNSDHRSGIWSNRSGGPVWSSCEIYNNKLHFYHYNNDWYSTFGNTTLTAGKWYHVVFVIKNRVVTFYLDGVYDGSGDATLSGDNQNLCDSIGCSWTSSYSLNGNLNDVRIYDHALSAKEVKEISKGLVLHYNFEEDIVTQSNKNLVSDITNGGRTVRDGPDSLHTSGDNGDTYFYINFGEELTFGKHYVIMCDVSGFASDSDWWDFPLCSQSFEDTLRLKNGFCYAQFEYKESQWTTTTKMILDDLNYSSSSVRTRNIYITNIKVVEISKIFDNSGYGYNGTPINSPQIKIDSASGNHYIDLRDALNGYLDLGIGTLNFITEGTLCFWARFPTSNYKMILGANDSGSRYYLAWSGSGNWYSSYASHISAYCDGVERNNPIIDDNWHFYCFIGLNLSSWGDYHYYLCVYAGEVTNSFQFHGDLADFKIYATALSALDILVEYNRKASIDRNGNLIAPYVKEYETTNNIGELANYYIETQHAFDGRFGSLKESDYNAYYPNGEPGLGTYEQGNLIVTMTNQGIRIYSEANRDGRAQEGSEWNTWGGFCWSPMKQFRCLIKGHHYRISWHVKGQSSRAMTDVYWSNQIGWGQWPDASPTVHKSVTHPANFQGEMDCFYDFTIEDDIFKTTGSEVHSGFEPNTSYLAYSAFKIGYTYDFTGPLGTDIYITNLQLHDLTTNEVYKIEKNGIVKTTEVISGRRDSARLHSDGVIDITDIEEC